MRAARGPQEGSPEMPYGLRQATITSRLPAVPESAAAARRELETLRELDAEEYRVVALLVTELIANSIEHAGTKPSGTLDLDVALTDQVVRVEVRDEGPGFAPTSRTADSPIDSQWGLYLMDQLADRWKVAADPPGAVRFELDRARRPARRTSRLAEHQRGL
jgi:anti-sigma regulatory factor (Ser/Thr protein kinase)